MVAKTQPRQPRGTPVGGEFAAKANPEADIELDDAARSEVHLPTHQASRRTDIHRPEVFDPEDYEWVGAYDNDPEPGSFVGATGEFEVAPGVMVEATNWANANYRYMRGLVESSKTARYGTGAQCDHCGAKIRYVAVYRHKPTGDHIAVGETCADERLPLDKATFQRLRKSAELDRRQQAKKREARAALDGLTNRNVAALLDRETDPDGLDDVDREVWEHHIVSDIRERLWRYGAVSDRQVELVAKIRSDVEHARTAPPAPEIPDMPVPEGVRTIEGTIRAMKYQDSQWGGSVKMLVEVTTPEGRYRVWGTLPRALSDLYRVDYGPRLANGSVDTRRTMLGIGKRVRFQAGVERSEDDEAFGFFSRPTKAKMLDNESADSPTRSLAREPRP